MSVLFTFGQKKHKMAKYGKSWRPQQQLTTLMFILFMDFNHPGVISSFQVFRRRGSQDAAARLSDKGEVRFMFLYFDLPLGPLCIQG